MNWYIGGYCNKRKALRLFKLARISNISVCKEFFEPRQIDLESFITPMFNNKECVDCTLRVTAYGRETILRVFGEEALTQETKTTWIAQIPLRDNEQGYGFVAGLGHGCEVLKPKKMRAKIQQ